MRQSQLFTKTRREAPADETSKNAQLLIRGGYVHKEMAGVYSLLPLGLKTVANIKKIVSEEVEKIGSQEILMSTLQNKETWLKTDRWSDDAVDVWFKSQLKSGGEIGFGWSHEEPITEMEKNFIMSYKDLPVVVHQFQNKLRNEVRAKSGLLRGREFVMKDMYCFAATDEANQGFYEKARQAYLEVFRRVGLGEATYVTSASGGVFTDKFSHEFQTVCDAGEDNIYINEGAREAVNEEIYKEEPGFKKVKAAEVGNIFNFGSKKCEQMGLQYKDHDGSVRPAFLSSYGIGITRLLAVIAEVMSDEKGLVLPESIAPFKYHIIEIISENSKVRETAEVLYKKLGENNCLYDDREARAGEKFADADLLGMPWQVIVSERSFEAGGVELKNRKTGETKIVSQEYFSESLS